LEKKGKEGAGRYRCGKGFHCVRSARVRGKGGVEEKKRSNTADNDHHIKGTVWGNKRVRLSKK